MSRTITETQKFGSDIVWIALSQVLTYLLSIVILPALTKSYTTEMYGVWTQVNITAAIVGPILMLYLGAAQVRFMPREKGRAEKRQAFGAMLWPVVTFACLIFSLSVLLKKDLAMLIFGSVEYTSFVPLTFLLASIDTFTYFSLAFFQATARMKLLAVIQLVSSAFQMILIVTLATLGYSLMLIIACLIMLRFLVGALTFGMIVKEIGLPTPNINKLGYFLAYSVPLIPTGLLFFALSSSDRYLITHLVSLSQAGIYSASYNLANIISLFIVPIIFVLFPTLVKLWEQDELARVRNHIGYATKVFLAIAIPGAAGLYVLSQPLLSSLATHEYAAGGGLVLLLALGTIFYGVYLINVGVIQLIEQTRWLPIVMGIAVAVNISANLVLLPKIGIMGAGIAMVTSYFVMASIVAVWARRTIRYRIDLKFMAKVVLATALMALCLSFIKVYNAMTILLTTCAGVAIYAAGLFVSRAFSVEDKMLAKEILAGLLPTPWSGKPHVDDAESTKVESQDRKH